MEVLENVSRRAQQRDSHECTSICIVTFCGSLLLQEIQRPFPLDWGRHMQRALHMMSEEGDSLFCGERGGHGFSRFKKIEKTSVILIIK